jgi:hypothetical protein
MTPASFLVLLPALLGLAGSGVMPAPQAGILLAQNEVIMRIPLSPRRIAPVEWVERKGPNCIAVESIRGAMLSGPNHVDFLMPRRQRIRAELSEDCPALDFYSGFYVAPEEEGLICARRDSISSRMGGSCTIDRFRRLVPKLRD